MVLYTKIIKCPASSKENQVNKEPCKNPHRHNYDARSMAAEDRQSAVWFNDSALNCKMKEQVSEWLFRRKALLGGVK